MKRKNYSLKSFSLFFKAIANTKHEMWVSLQVLVVITIILSVILFVVENMAQPDVYTNVWDSCLWAFMSYIGDPGHFAEFAPVTLVGRVIAVLIGIIGIAIFAVPAGLIGSGFMDAIAEDRKEQQLKEASAYELIYKDNHYGLYNKKYNKLLLPIKYKSISISIDRWKIEKILFDGKDFVLPNNLLLDIKTKVETDTCTCEFGIRLNTNKETYYSFDMRFTPEKNLDLLT